MSLRDIFRMNLKSVQICSKLCMLPIEFTKFGTAKICENLYKRVAFYCLFANALLYTSYISVRFVQVVTADKISILQFAPHAFILSVAVITLFLYAYLFIWMEPLTNIVFNELLDIISNIRPSKASLQERLVTVLPFICLEATVLYLFIPYVLLPDSPQSVYAGLTLYFQKSPLLMVTAILYESLTVGFLVFCFNYVVFVQLGILQSTQRELEAGVKELRDNVSLTAVRLLEHVQKCLQIQLRMAYFNKVYSLSVYMLKLECMLDGTFGIFLAIKVWGTNPILAATCGALGVVDSACYCSMYNRGFRIPALVQEYGGCIMAKTAGRNTAEVMEVRKAVRSISKVAVKVGQFRELERASTVEFVDFIVINLVNLLVAYPGSIRF